MREWAPDFGNLLLLSSYVERMNPNFPDILRSPCLKAAHGATTKKFRFTSEMVKLFVITPPKGVFRMNIVHQNKKYLQCEYDCSFHQPVPYHDESGDRQGVVGGVSEQRPAGQMDRLGERQIVQADRQTDRQE